MPDARSIVDQANAAGLGDAPDDAAREYRETLALLTDTTVTPVHADVLRWHGTQLRDRGRTSEAEPLYERSMEISRQIGYRLGIAHSLNCIAGLAQRRGDLRQAGQLLADAALLADDNHDTRLLTMIHANLGIIADVRGDVNAAIDHHRAALSVAEAGGDEQQMLAVLINFVVLSTRRGQLGEADRMVTRGLSFARAGGNLLAEGLLEENRAEVLLLRGDLDRAAIAIGRALDVAAQRRDDIRTAGALKLRGAHERMCGKTDDAAHTLRYALTLAAVGEDALLGAELLHEFALALYSAGNVAMAREVWDAALEAFARIGALAWVERVANCLAGDRAVRPISWP
jgi:tetratricopeptide (TPR) repeat protein